MGLFGKDDDDKAAAAPAGGGMKARYASAINAMTQLGVRTESIQEQGGKLVIRAVAPSEDAKNQVWNHIKKQAAWQSEVSADIRVEQTGGGGGGHAAGGGSQASGARTYTVKAGDTLSKISKEFYGDANQYNKIFEANRNQLSDADKIQPGQVLQIP